MTLLPLLRHRNRVCCHPAILQLLYAFVIDLSAFASVRVQSRQFFTFWFHFFIYSQN